jgi:Na+/melibiose symporter-like transporter
MVSRNKGWAKFVTVMGTIVTILLCLVMAGLGGSGTFDNVFLGYGVGIVMIIGFILLIKWFSNIINMRGFTPEQRERRKTVFKCARINNFKAPGMFDKTGGIQFQFENVQFGQEFASLNMGQME